MSSITPQNMNFEFNLIYVDKQKKTNLIKGVDLDHLNCWRGKVNQKNTLGGYVQGVI